MNKHINTSEARQLARSDDLWTGNEVCRLLDEIDYLDEQLSLEQESNQEECQWVADEYESYWTSCGNGWVFEEGGPTDNDMKFCCFCGKHLVDIPYLSDYDPEEDAKIDDEGCK